jgi:membrane protease YdiL (CAAX protease family)
MGNPAPPYGPQYGHGYAFPHPPPPDPPELPASASRWPPWPWWYAFAAFGIGVVVTLFAVAVIAVIATAAGAENVEDSKGFLQGATVLQQLIFVTVAVLLAAQTLRPRAWHFGFRRSRLWPAVGWAALGFLVYFVFAAIYASLVAPDEEQETLESLGTEDGTLWLVGAAMLVITFAPFAEEFFFRGFFYRALRTKLPIVAAAVVVGLIFGAIHLGGTPVELLPPLMILGVVFCLLYEKTGTLFAPIALHAFNNTIAFGVSTEEWEVAGIVGALTLLACFLVPRFLAPRATPAPAPA